MSQEIITSLSQSDSDPEQVAQNFILDFGARPSDLYVQLANIICYSCKLPTIPQSAIENADLAAINAFFQRLFINYTGKAMNTAINDLLSSREWPNVVDFYHHLIHFKWDLLTGSSKFDSFFVKFLSLLTITKFPVLRYFGGAIQLEFISVIAHRKSELLQGKTKGVVLEYANHILRRSFDDSERRIWTYCLLRMRQWFRHNEGLLDHELLRFLVWGLRDCFSANFCASLQVIVELLENHSELDLWMTPFVKSLLSSLVARLGEADANLFEKICDCAFTLHRKYRHLSSHFVDTLLDFTFAPSRAKAKVAANLFLRTKLSGNLPAFEQLRQIIQFLAHRNSIFVELFVDSMIDECELLTNWNAMAHALQLLTDISEQEKLLLVILCAARLVLDGAKPYIRDEKTEIRAVGNVAAAFTSVFAPLLDTLSGENVTFRWRLLVVYLATYFDFDMVEDQRMGAVLKEYLDTFTATTAILDVTQTTLILQLVFVILQRNREHEFLNTVVNLKTLFENEFVKLARHRQSATAEERTAMMNVVIGIYALRSILPINQKCLLEVPLQLLQEEPAQADPVVTAMCREMAIIFCSEYVEELLTKSSSDTSSISNTAPVNMQTIESTELVINVLVDCLSEYFNDGRLGQLVFFALCRILKALSSATVWGDSRYSVFTENQNRLLRTYVAWSLRVIDKTNCELAPELSAYVLENLVRHYCDLIVCGILPLYAAYDFLQAHCCQTYQLGKELRSFLLSITERKSPKEMAEWLVSYFIHNFQRISESTLVMDDLVKWAKRLSQVLQTMRNAMLSTMKHVHTMGVDFAISQEVGKEIRLPRGKFLLILVEFSPCLNAKLKKKCYEYFRQKRVVNSMVDVAKLYSNSLTVSKKRRNTADDVEDPSLVEGNDLVSEMGTLRLTPEGDSSGVMNDSSIRNLSAGTGLKNSGGKRQKRGRR